MAEEEEDEVWQQAREAHWIHVVGQENAPLPPAWKKAWRIQVVFGFLPIPCAIAWAFHAERNGGAESIWALLGISAAFFWGFIVLPTILYIGGAIVEASQNPNAQ